MHVVGYLYEAYHDARSLERKVLRVIAGDRRHKFALCAPLKNGCCQTLQMKTFSPGPSVRTKRIQFHNA
jgi:hypothetical protein